LSLYSFSNTCMGTVSVVLCRHRCTGNVLLPMSLLL